MIIDRLMSLGIAKADAEELDLCLDEGFPDDSVPILLKYEQQLAQFMRCSGVLYRGTIVPLSLLGDFEAGKPVPFNHPWKAWSFKKSVALHFTGDMLRSDEFAVALAMRADGCRVLDMGALLGLGRWKKYREVWVECPTFTIKQAFRVVQYQRSKHGG